jgi:hypothetical protein
MCVVWLVGWLVGWIGGIDRYRIRLTDGINGSTRPRRMAVAARWLDSGHPMDSESESPSVAFSPYQAVLSLGTLLSHHIRGTTLA